MRNELAIHKSLTILLMGSFGCMALVTFRMVVTGKTTFDFMLFNLILAWIPYLLLLIRDSISRISRPGSYIVLFGWMIFLPNASYLITDLIHIKARTPVPIWFDALLLQSFALLGILLHTYSILPLERSITRSHGSKMAQYVMLFVHLLVSIGVAIGRFLRFNSWDIVLEPIDVTLRGFGSLDNTRLVVEMGAFTFFFFCLLYGSFYTLTRRITRDSHLS